MENKNYVYQTEGALLRLLKFKIRFSQTNNAYLLNDKWANEIDEHYFMNQAKEVQRLLNKQLKHGKHHEVFLENLLNRIWNRLQNVQMYLAITPEIIKNYSEIKDPIIPHKETPYSNGGWYKKFKKRSDLETTLGNDRLIYLNFNYEKLNDYKTRIDFEYGLLSYAIQKYYEAVSNLHSYVFSLVENARYIDFKSLKIEDENVSDASTKTGIKLHFNLNKIDTAYLFRFLLEAKIIVFDDNDERKNELQMKRFVDTYLTYLNTSEKKVPMKNFNREYSEAKSFTNIKEFKSFIDGFKTKIEDYRNSLKD
mgnify:CR=1 FL=1